VVVPWWRVRSRVRRDGYDVDEEDGGQDPGSEYDSEDATSMWASFVTLLAQLSKCKKQQDIRLDEYDDKIRRAG